MRGEKSETPNAYVLAAASALVLLAIFWPAFDGRVYTDSDLGAFHLPMRVFHADALKNGTDFLWYPYSYAGFHLHGEGQAALYHPASWLLYR